MRHISFSKSRYIWIYKALTVMLVILSVLGLEPAQTALAQGVLIKPSLSSKTLDCPAGTFSGSEAYASTITLQMPFIAGETWMVGGVGSFYGNGAHCNSPNNDHYATDWNRTNDNGAAVYT